MPLRLTVVAVCVAACAAAWPAAAADRLTLDDAFERVARTHPELRLFGARSEALAAELDRASLRPAYVAGSTLENALGSGNASGLGSAELTLTLSSVFERGGKLDARRTLAQSRVDALAVERESRRLDLLAEVARRYLAVVAARQQSAIAQRDIGQRQRTVMAARQRHQAGASPESVLLTAQAALARAELDLARSEQRGVAARQHLAALWGEQAPDFDVVQADALELADVADFATLVQWLERNPELASFTDARRIGEARLQLARTEGTADVTWQVGVRRLQASDDVGLTAGISIPLGSSGRARSGVRAAAAELAGLEIEREAAGLSLYSTLAEAHGRYRVAQLEVSRLGGDVLPMLERAEAAASRAYLAGAASYLEWASLQAERTAALRQQLDAALDGQRALIEIQRLTGQAFIAGPAPSTEGARP